MEPTVGSSKWVLRSIAVLARPRVPGNAGQRRVTVAESNCRVSRCSSTDRCGTLEVRAGGRLRAFFGSTSARENAHRGTSFRGSGITSIDLPDFESRRRPQNGGIEEDGPLSGGLVLYRVIA